MVSIKTFPNMELQATKNFKNMEADNPNRRQNDIKSKMNSQLKNKTNDKDLEDFVGIISTVQFLFIWGINAESDISKELASFDLCGKTTGQNIFKEVKKKLILYNLKWNLSRCVTIDGGKSMYGAEQNLDGQMYKTCESIISKPFITHCTIHQQVLWGQCSIMCCEHSGINSEFHGFL